MRKNDKFNSPQTQSHQFISQQQPQFEPSQVFNAQKSLIQQLEFHLKQAELQMGSLQSQYDIAIQTQQTSQEKDQLIRYLQMQLHQKEQKIIMLLDENSKVVNLLQNNSSQSTQSQQSFRNSAREYSSATKQNYPNANSQEKRRMLSNQKVGLPDQESKIQDLQRKLTLILEENTQLQRMMNEQKNEQMSPKFLQKFKEMESTVKEQKQIIERQQKEIIKLRINHIKQHSGEDPQMNQLLLKNQNLLQEIIESKKNEEDFRNQIKSLQNEIEQIKQESQRDKEKVKENEQEKQEQIQKRQNDDSYDDKYSSFHSTKFGDPDQSKRLRDKIYNLTNENNKKQHKIEELQEEIRQIKFEQENKIQNIKLECAQDIRAIQDKMKQEMKQQLQTTNDSSKQLQDQVRQLNLENQKLKSQLNRKDQEICNLENKIADLLKQSADISSSIQQEQGKQNELVKEKQWLERQIEDMQEEMDNITQQMLKEKQNAKIAQQLLDAIRQENRKFNLSIEKLGEQLQDKLNESLNNSRVEKMSNASIRSNSVSPFKG